MSAKQKSSKLKIITLSLAVMLTAASCNFGFGSGPKAEQEIQLTWWKPFDEPRQVEPLIEEFQKAYPKVRVNYVKKDIDTYEEELINALASGTGPDIFSIHNDWLPKHKEKLAAAPEKLISIRDYQNDFAAAVAEDFINDYKIYGVPLAIDVLALYYNKNILASAGIARPPATWEELVDMVPKLTRQDNLGNFQRQAIALGTADNINRAPDILALLMLQNGTPLYSTDKNEAAFDQTIEDENGDPYQPGARALEFYTQFANPAKTTYTWNNRSNNSIEAFAAGQVGMIFSYSYLRQTLAEKAPFLNYGIVGVPQIAGSSLRVNHANYWGEAVSKQSKSQTAAWEFLKYISSKDVLPAYYEVVKQPSSNVDVLKDQISDAEIGVFAENALSAKSFYKPDSDAVENILVEAIKDMTLRNATAVEAISSASEKVNLLIKR